VAQTNTITLADIQQAVDELSRKEGISPDEVVGRAVKQHIFNDIAVLRPLVPEILVAISKAQPGVVAHIHGNPYERGA